MHTSTANTTPLGSVGEELPTPDPEVGQQEDDQEDEALYDQHFADQDSWEDWADTTMSQHDHTGAVLDRTGIEDQQEGDQVRDVGDDQTLEFNLDDDWECWADDQLTQLDLAGDDHPPVSDDQETLGDDQQGEEDDRTTVEDDLGTMEDNNTQSRKEKTHQTTQDTRSCPPSPQPTLEDQEEGAQEDFKFKFKFY